MTGAERRLDAVTGGLTARERVLLYFRPAAIGEGELDERIPRYCPEDQKAEFERLWLTIAEANDGLHQVLGYELEWLQQLETEIAWLESLDALLGRCDALQRELLRAGVDVRERGERRRRRRAAKILFEPAPLPPPGRGFRRDLPRVFGRKAGEDGPLPASWREAREALIRACRWAVLLRWQTARAMEIGLAELAGALGESVTHHRVRELLDSYTAKTLELRDALVPLSGPLEFEEPTEEQLSVMREWAKVEEVRPNEPEPVRSRWMSEGERSEREELEAELLQQARA